MNKLEAILISVLGLCVFVWAEWSFYGGPWCAQRLVDVAVGAGDNAPVIYGVNQD